jgi:WD40 repeat protein
LASGSEDGSIKLWDTDQGTLEKTLKGHLNFVNSVQFSSAEDKGKLLVSGSSDMTVKVWDMTSF